MKENAKAKVVSIYSDRETTYNAKSEYAQNIIGSRIKEARNSKKISLAKMSELLADYGVKIVAAGIGKWERGESVPNAYQLIAIKEALKLEDSFAYFISSANDVALNAEGRNKVAAYRQDLIASGLYKPKKAAECLIRYVRKPLYNHAVSAGNGQYLSDDHAEMVDFPENTVPQNADYALRISGDSMEPVYQNGQIVWVQECESINPGEVGIFICDDESFIKVYNEDEPDENNIDAFTDSYGQVHMQVVLVSYNPKYAPRRISPYSSFKVCGRVLN